MRLDVMLTSTYEIKLLEINSAPGVVYVEETFLRGLMRFVAENTLGVAGILTAPPPASGAGKGSAETDLNKSQHDVPGLPPLIDYNKRRASYGESGAWKQNSRSDSQVLLHLACMAGRVPAA